MDYTHTAFGPGFGGVTTVHSPGRVHSAYHSYGGFYSPARAVTTHVGGFGAHTTTTHHDGWGLGATTTTTSYSPARSVTHVAHGGWGGHHVTTHAGGWGGYGGWGW